MMKRLSAAPSGRYAWARRSVTSTRCGAIASASDALAGQESRDLGAIGIDLGLNLVEIVAGRGVAQRPDREIGLHKGLGQTLDRDVVLVRAAPPEAIADQPARTQHAERDQRGGDQTRSCFQECHPPAVCSVARKPVALAFEQIEEIVGQGIIEVVVHDELALGAARPTRLAGGLRYKPRDRLACRGDDDLLPQPHALDQLDRSALASKRSSVTVMTLSLSDHVTEAMRRVNSRQRGQTTRIGGIATGTIRISSGRRVREQSPRR